MRDLLTYLVIAFVMLPIAFFIYGSININLSALIEAFAK